MWQYVLKILITAALVVAISEVAKRNSFWAALLASLPLTSLLAFIWLYLESTDSGKVAQLSISIFWLVLPSLVLFITLPMLLRVGAPFFAALGLASAVTVAAYFAMLWLLGRFNVSV
jgi:hypothetical protein